MHTPITYEKEKLNLERISNLKKIYGIKTGYSHHFNNKLAIYLSSSYKPDSLFFYCKQFFKEKRVYPDDQHALFIDEVDKVKKNFETCLFMLKMKKSNKNLKNEKTIFKEIKK